VLRLFPNSVPSQQVRFEAVVQQVLVAQDFAAPDVLWWLDDNTVLGRRFLVMQRMAGSAPLGGADLGAILRSVPWLLFRMPRTLARVQADLHSLDPTPLLDALPDLAIGVDRYLDRIDERVEAGAIELAPGARWLRAHRPPDSPTAICHGDLWPGNVLVDHGRLTAVIDFSVASVAEPALDVGFAAMSLSIAPIEAGPRVQRMLAAAAQWMCRRFVNAYTKYTRDDLSRQPYYEALRCVFELVNVVDYRHAMAKGRQPDVPAPTWDVATDRMVDYFEARTGVRLELPLRV
jgi:aminoglycoside phosphotransferase (APT) family kinase protein